MAQTARTMAALVTLLADNTTGAISAQDLRDMLESLNNPTGELSYFDTTGTTVVVAAQSDGSTNMVVAPVASALSASPYLFDNGGSDIGRLRYTGAVTKLFHVALSVSMASVGANDTYVLGIAKSGTVIAASKVLRKIAGGGDTGSTALHVMTTLAQNEYLELYVGNISDADNVVVKSVNIFAMGMMQQS